MSRPAECDAKGLPDLSEPMVRALLNLYAETAKFDPRSGRVFYRETGRTLRRDVVGALRRRGLVEYVGLPGRASTVRLSSWGSVVTSQLRRRIRIENNRKERTR